MAPRFPSLYQVNTRAWVSERSRSLGRPATLDDVPDAELDAVAGNGFDWVWLLSVWQTGIAGQEASRTDPEWRREFEATLPDLRDEDIGGSGFAITGYTVSAALGGDEALARIRSRLADRGLRLMLDFVPNHTALDHPWVEDHVDRYVHASELDLIRSPNDYTWVKRSAGDVLLAHGRDPYFPGWADTLQLDYSNPATAEAMTGELLSIGERCDGVRCDMAMLMLPDVFERTWGRPAIPFWPSAIDSVRESHPAFLFMAEVYWDLEWTMLQQGFDYAYDKRLYDRLRAGAARPVRDHLRAGLDYQSRLARFLENHDEPRAAAVFSAATHEAAGIVTYLSPGLRFFHQGQLEGRRIRLSPHLVRAPVEPVDQALADYYRALLEVVRDPVVRDGSWQLFECVPAWDGNWTADGFIAWGWRDVAGSQVVVAVNLAANQAQCYVRLPLDGLSGRTVRLEDRMSGVVYERDGDDLLGRGLYLDVAAWAYHVFDVSALPVEPGDAVSGQGTPTGPSAGA